MANQCSVLLAQRRFDKLRFWAEGRECRSSKHGRVRLPQQFERARVIIGPDHRLELPGLGPEGDAAWVAC